MLIRSKPASELAAAVLAGQTRAHTTQPASSPAAVKARKAKLKASTAKPKANAKAPAKRAVTAEVAAEVAAEVEAEVEAEAEVAETEAEAAAEREAAAKSSRTKSSRHLRGPHLVRARSRPAPSTITIVVTTISTITTITASTRAVTVDPPFDRRDMALIHTRTITHTSTRTVTDRTHEAGRVLALARLLAPRTACHSLCQSISLHLLFWHKAPLCNWHCRLVLRSQLLHATTLGMRPPCSSSLRLRAINGVTDSSSQLCKFVNEAWNVDCLCGMTVA
ncbi:MAG: hypothetical protein ACYCOU_14990, partial [Sulfobacillus sp.]